jgi:hypothetical protein
VIPPACVNLTVSGEVTHPITPMMVGYTNDPETIVIPYYDNPGGERYDPRTGKTVTHAAATDTRSRTRGCVEEFRADNGASPA